MPTHPQHVLVWCEIPVTDLEASMAFYNAVLDQDMTVDTTGPNPVAFFKAESFDDGIAGHLYPGVPSENGPTVHLMAPDDLDATRERIEASGGKVESPDVEIPAGKFFYARDLDGNSIGFFRPNS